MLAAEFGAESTDVDVDGAGATEEVVPPHLLEQLGAREHATRVLRQILQELELLVGQVEQPRPEPGGVAALVDRQIPGDDPLVGLVLDRVAAGHDQPQPGLDLGGAGVLEEDVLDRPLGVDRGQAALGEDRDDRRGGAGGADDAAQRAGLDERGARVDEDDVDGGGVDDRRCLGGQRAHLVPEQPQGRQDLGARRQVVREEQESGHRDPE